MISLFVPFMEIQCKKKKEKNQKYNPQLIKNEKFRLIPD